MLCLIITAPAIAQTPVRLFIQPNFKARILIIYGTQRQDSMASKVSAQVQNRLKAAGAHVVGLDLSKVSRLQLLPKKYAQPLSKTMADLQLGVKNADGIVIVLPEYNGGVPAALKALIDILDRGTFLGKPVTIVGEAAGQWGAILPAAELVNVLIYEHALIFPYFVYLARINSILTPDGTQIADPSIDKFLRDQATSFIGFVDRMRRVEKVR